MKHLFRLKKQSFSFDKKGMILKGEVCGGDNEEAIAIEDILNDCEIVEDK